MGRAVVGALLGAADRQAVRLPTQTAVSYFVVPVPPPASGPHGTREGVVEIKRIVVTYRRDNYDGDSRKVRIYIKNVGNAATAADVWQSWIT